MFRRTNSVFIGQISVSDGFFAIYHTSRRLSSNSWGRGEYLPAGITGSPKKVLTRRVFHAYNAAIPMNESSNPFVTWLQRAAGGGKAAPGRGRMDSRGQTEGAFCFVGATGRPSVIRGLRIHFTDARERAQVSVSSRVAPQEFYSCPCRLLRGQGIFICLASANKDRRSAGNCRKEQTK